jgi:predicted HD superfamily hydrolase involved in NAD metabolism
MSSNREKIISWLQKNVSEHRLQHILGVEKMSRELAVCHGVDPEKAARAGLMHDLAKFFPPAKLLAMAEAEGLEIDPICRTNPHLLHANVSAIVARDEFGVEDAELLESIANHTLGRVQMSILSCIIFVADVLEPNRGGTEELKAMRRVSKKNIYRGLEQTCDYSLRYLLGHHLIIHPQTVLTRNWALSMARQDKE